eukprot:scaffold610952_cov41-Prasinocladus_malaysianus.AAC.1
MHHKWSLFEQRGSLAIQEWAWLLPSISALCVMQAMSCDVQSCWSIAGVIDICYACCAACSRAGADCGAG